MTPSNASSLRSGTISNVRMPPISTAVRGTGSCGTVGAYSARSARCTSLRRGPDGRPGCSGVVRALPQQSREPFRDLPCSGSARKRAPSRSHQRAAVRAAQAARLLQYRVEHRGEVAGRGIDHLQYLGGRGLLLQRLARLGQQPRVLHRDDRLRRKVLQQRDLLVGERPDLRAGRHDHPKQRIALAQWHR